MKNDLMHVLQVAYSRHIGFSPRVGMTVFFTMTFLFKRMRTMTTVAGVVWIIAAFRIYDTFAVRTPLLKKALLDENKTARGLFVKNFLMSLTAYILIMLFEVRAMAGDSYGNGRIAYTICILWMGISRVIAALDFAKRKERDMRIINKVVDMEESLDEEAKNSRYYISMKKQWTKLHPELRT